MAKTKARYLFKVFDKGDLKSQIIVPAEEMLETLKTLNKLGVVKGYVLIDQEEEGEENDI